MGRPTSCLGARRRRVKIIQNKFAKEIFYVGYHVDKFDKAKMHRFHKPLTNIGTSGRERFMSGGLALLDITQILQLRCLDYRALCCDSYCGTIDFGIYCTGLI